MLPFGSKAKSRSGLSRLPADDSKGLLLESHLGVGCQAIDGCETRLEICLEAKGTAVSLLPICRTSKGVSWPESESRQPI